MCRSLWGVCDAAQSHLAAVAAPVLLHCATLAGGADVLCALLRDAFQHADAARRFAAVERAAVLLRFVRPAPARASPALQAALAAAACYLVASMDDASVHVAQRATLYLGAVHDDAIEVR